MTDGRTAKDDAARRREALVERAMRELGVDRERAEFIAAMTLGELPSIVVGEDGRPHPVKY